MQEQGKISQLTKQAFPLKTNPPTLSSAAQIAFCCRSVTEAPASGVCETTTLCLAAGPRAPGTGGIVLISGLAWLFLCAQWLCLWSCTKALGTCNILLGTCLMSSPSLPLSPLIFYSLKRKAYTPLITLPQEHGRRRSVHSGALPGQTCYSLCDLVGGQGQPCEEIMPIFLPFKGELVLKVVALSCMNLSVMYLIFSVLLFGL